MKEREFSLSIGRDSFYNAAMLIYENKNDDIRFIPSLLVNEALACELSIKVILENRIRSRAKLPSQQQINPTPRASQVGYPPCEKTIFP